MRKITKIDAVKAPEKIQNKIRVAAYCRVSTDSDAQLESLEVQKSHYENYINSRDDWEFAGLYYDEGITGTKKDKRPDLLRLISDCKAGKIDFVITKSISRFSRNTADCLEIVRLLLELNIPIYFEKENINTASMESELFLSILSSMAENESVSISQNSKWSIQKRFENGNYKIGYPPYGYNWDGEKIVINEEQAAIVKEIFSDILSGRSIKAIATELNQRNILTKRGGHWTVPTICGMLSNEKYVGDCLFQKTYTDSSFNRHNNHGDRTQYMARNHHSAIISKEDFDKVQSLLKQKAVENGIEIGADKYQNRYAFSGKIICGECGNTFKRRSHYSKDGGYIAWCCKTHIEDKTKCSMLYVHDNSLKGAFITMMNKLIFGYRFILKPYANAIKNNEGDDFQHRIQELQTQLAQNTEKRETLTRLMTSGYIDKVIFTKENNELLTQADALRKEIENLRNNVSSNSEKLSAVKELLLFTEKGIMLDSFNGDLFEKFVSRIVIISRHKACFELKCGLSLTERI